MHIRPNSAVSTADNQFRVGVVSLLVNLLPNSSDNLCICNRSTLQIVKSNTDKLSVVLFFF